MSDRDHFSRNLGLLIDKRKPEEVVIGLTNGTVITGHTAISGRLSDWFNRVEVFIVFPNAGVDDGWRQKILIINKNQILWAKPGLGKPDTASSSGL
jgi:hypothetical protein